MRRILTFSTGLASGLLFLSFLACAQQPAPPGPAPAVKALEAPRALPAVDPNSLLTFPVLFSRTETMPSIWRNDLRKPFTILTVVCKTSSGVADILPVAEPGALTSVLTNTCPCRPDKWSMCAVNGFPKIHPYSDDATTCATLPCEMGILVIKSGGATDVRVSITGSVGP